jgi:hypothetical protein
MRFALGFLLGVLSASTIAVAADRSDDWILTIDVESGGAIKRRLAFAQHVDIPTADWGGMRSAAGTSLASLDGWFDSYSNGAWNTWWDTFTSTQKEQARQALLKGS